ncbi:MAG: UbiA prenyltransferase family protein, partial [Bacteroidota bacterium]
MKHYIKLLRPHQYLKNFFILSPLFFAFKFKDLDLVLKVGLVTACFCLVASAIYILNDYFDVEEDRKHPVKRNRPLASGAVPMSHALPLVGILLLVGCGGMFFISKDALMLTGIYVGNNLLYSYRLKHVPILDISMISVGFVLRLFIGSAAGEGELPLSMWIIMVTFLLALFLALAKRRDDVLLRKEGKKVRKNIDGYNLEFINGAMMIMASVVLVS